MVTSTRKNVSISIVDAIINGLSKDKGLYTFKNIDSSFFNKQLLELSYNELTLQVFTHLMDGYSITELETIINTSYSSDNFSKDVVTLKVFDNHTYIELFRGNTFAFKDVSLSILPNLFKQAKEIKGINNKTVILTATSGDTGSAALNGFSKLDNTHVFVLYPKDGVSEFQEKQMLSYQNENNKVIAVEGNFDDCQNIVKQIFIEMKPKHLSLSSANSINIGRIVPQIVYYLYTYNCLVNKNKITFNDPINICVPSGNFGNIYAAFLAKQLGLPVNKLIIASNKNDVLTDLFNKGIYQTNRELHQTMSPSMDILISSNFERYLYYLLGGNTGTLTRYMEQLSSKGVVSIKELQNQTDFVAFKATEKETLEEIEKVYNDDGYLIDSHTAVGRNALRKYHEKYDDDTYSVIASTASPFKFFQSINKALNITTETDLKSRITDMALQTNTHLDERILQVLDIDNKEKRIIKTKAEVSGYLKELIGDLDV